MKAPDQAVRLLKLSYKKCYCYGRLEKSPNEENPNEQHKK